MSISLKEVREIIFFIEQKFPVDTWEINGIKIWPLIRIKINYHLVYQSFGTDISGSIQSQTKIDLIKRVLFAPIKWLYYSFVDIRNNSSLFGKTDVILLGTGVTFTKVNNKWLDKFCDPISDELSKCGLKSKRYDLAHKYIIPRYKPSYFLQFLIDISIVKSILTFNRYKKEYKLDQYDEFLEYLVQNKFTAKINLDKESFAKQIYKISKIKDLYIKILKKSEAKAAMSVCYYDDMGMAMNLACDELNLPSFDIQHGVQGDNHASYGRWSKVPVQGYQLLPNYFLCWGKFESDAINNWSEKINNHKPITIGNLYLNTWKSNDNQLSIDYDKIFYKYFDDTKKSILVSISWDVSSEHHIRSTLETILRTQYKYNWLIRLHPSMISQKPEIIKMFKDFGISQFEINHSTSLPLYALLRKVDLNITHSSTTVIEAAEFGVNSIITSDYGWQLLSNQVDKKFISFIDDAEQMVHYLSDLHNLDVDSNRVININNFESVINSIRKAIS